MLNQRLKMPEEIVNPPEGSHTQLATDLGAGATNSLGHDPEIIKSLNLESSYRQQLEVLYQAGLVQELTTGEVGIIGIDSREYAAPKLEAIARILNDREDDLRPVIQEGYTKLLLVPFGLPIANLFRAYESELIRKMESGEAQDAEGNQILAPYPNINPSSWGESLVKKDSDFPMEVNARLEPKLKYGPAVFLRKRYLKTNFKKDNSPTKPELLQDPSETPGWQVLLLKDEPESPMKITDGPYTRNHYLWDMQQEGKQGMTPESWFSYALSELLQKNQVIDYRRESLLLGAGFRKAFDFTPTAGWRSWKKNPEPNDAKHLVLGCCDSLLAYDIGARYAVKIS